MTAPNRTWCTGSVLPCRPSAGESDGSRWCTRGICAICYGSHPEFASGVDHHAIATRITRALEKQGLLLRDDPTPCLDVESADEFEHLLAASVHYRIATAPRTGRKAPTLRTVASNPLADNPCIPQIWGFSLHPPPNGVIGGRHALPSP